MAGTQWDSISTRRTNGVLKQFFCRHRKTIDLHVADNRNIGDIGRQCTSIELHLCARCGKAVAWMYSDTFAPSKEPNQKGGE